MNATKCDERRRVTFPDDLEPKSPVVIDTVVSGREWIVRRVSRKPVAQGYSRGKLVKDANGLLVWDGDVGEEPSAAALRHRAEDDRARE